MDVPYRKPMQGPYVLSLRRGRRADVTLRGAPKPLLRPVINGETLRCKGLHLIN